MRTIRQTGTSAELAVRRALYARGLRYRVDVRPSRVIATRADIVFKRQRIAVFIDGCFWHRCPVHATYPKSNSVWWASKLAANVERDRQNSRLLEKEGWLVLRFWGHELPSDVSEAIANALGARAAVP